MSRLKCKRALVCGASQGIGEAICQVFAKQGAGVVALARNYEKLKNMINSLQKNEMSHRALVADLSKLDTVTLKKVLEDGKIDILVCNSSGPKGGALADAQSEEFINAFNQHLISNQKLVSHLLPMMKEQGWGRIINIISTSLSFLLSIFSIAI